MVIRILLALFGVIELVFPKQVIDYLMDVTTAGEPTYEFEPWVYRLARLEGLAFVLLAFWWGKRQSPSE